MDDKTRQLRSQMISAMWKEGTVPAPKLRDAFLEIPRHLFLPSVPIEKAYEDVSVPLKTNTSGVVTASASQPTMMAIMLDQLHLKAGDNVLEIGTASGYNAAIMQYLVGDSGRVTSVEIDKDLADAAERNLIRANMGQVKIVHADGASGYAPRAAYDRILATVGVWDIPPMWVKQLKDNGRIVAPIWIDGVQMSACFTKQPDGTLLSTDNRGCAFVYMQGVDAMPDVRRQVASSALTIISDAVDAIDTVRLHTLLSDDSGICNLDSRLSPRQYWDGFQLYLMLNIPPNTHFVLYAVHEDRQAYGLEKRGMALIMPTAAAFVPYHQIGVCYCFGGSDAFMHMQESLDAWDANGRPNAHLLRLRLTPKTQPKPTITQGKLYERRHHYLHAWLEIST